MAWTDYRGAPSIGDALCRIDDVPPDAAKTLRIGNFPIILVRGQAGLRAFVNACPHQYLPLDHRGDRLLSADGATVRCTNHGAGFDADTGEGTEGFGLGCALDAIPVAERDGMIVVGA